jgi:hypothetical protein
MRDEAYKTDMVSIGSVDNFFSPLLLTQHTMATLRHQFATENNTTYIPIHVTDHTTEKKKDGPRRIYKLLPVVLLFIIYSIVGCLFISNYKEILEYLQHLSNYIRETGSR